MECPEAHFLSGFAVRQLQRGQGPALGWGEGWLAGYTDEGAWRGSSVDNVTGGRPQCTQEEGPAQEVGREKAFRLGGSLRHKIHSVPEAGGDRGQGQRFRGEL